MLCFNATSGLYVRAVGALKAFAPVSLTNAKYVIVR